MLTAEELAHHLGVDENTVYRWSRGGRIPALKVGRWWRFRVGEVEAALTQGPSASHDLVDPLGGALRRGDHVVAYDLEPGLAGRLARAFVAAGTRRGAIVARVDWDASKTRRPHVPPHDDPADATRLVTLDAASIPVARAEAALREWASAARKRFGGAREIWIHGSPPPPSVDVRIARLEAVLMQLAPLEGWIVLCLYERRALPERGRLAALHAGELAVASDEVRVLVPRH